MGEQVKTVLLRSIPGWLHRDWKMAAAAAEQSMQQYAITAIYRAVREDQAKEGAE